jgi:S-adenosylmethionine:tRNA ribosyltransferase-isomerase
VRAATTFVLPHDLEADAPPLTRDGVRLLVARERRPLRHARFTDLPAALRPGDLVVVNTSATEPAAVEGHRADGRPVVVHVSGPAPGRGESSVVVELRTPTGSASATGGAARRCGCPAGSSRSWSQATRTSA